MSSHSSTALLLFIIMTIITSVFGEIPEPCLPNKRPTKRKPVPMVNFWFEDPCGRAIMKLDKANRPDPTEFYDATALEQHLAPFKQAGPSAGFLVSQLNLMKFVFDETPTEATTVGYSTEQFVTTIPELKALIEWAKEHDCKENCANLKAQKQMNLIEAALGIPTGDWANQHMILVVFDGTEIAKQEEHNLRIPSGKEANANKLWKAGGFLPTGFHTQRTGRAPLKEALVDKLLLSTATFYSIYVWDAASESWKWENEDTPWNQPTTIPQIREHNGEVLVDAERVEANRVEVTAAQLRRASSIFKRPQTARSEYDNFYESGDIERNAVHKKNAEARSGSYGVDGDYGLHESKRTYGDAKYKMDNDRNDGLHGKSKMVYSDHGYRMDNGNDDEFWLVFAFSIIFTGLLIIICCVVLFICGALIGWKGNQLSNNKMEFQREDSLSDA